MKKIAGFVLLTAAICAFFSCENFFSQINANRIPAEGGTISIVLNSDESRTVLPQTPEFIKYRLEFENKEGLTSDVQILTDNKADISLPEGKWKITAYGIVEFDGAEADAAQGYAEVEVKNGISVNAAITITPQMSGVQGSFTWKLSTAAGINLTSWTVKLSEFGSETLIINESGTFSGYTNPLSQSGTVTLNPGYYICNMRVSGDTQTAHRTEIVHVASALDSVFDCALTKDDFVKYIRVSGKMSLTVSGIPQELAECSINVMGSGLSTDSITGVFNTDGSWEVFLESSSSKNFYFFLFMMKTKEGLVFDHFSLRYLDTLNDIEIPSVTDVRMRKVSGKLKILKGETEQSFSSMEVSLKAEKTSTAGTYGDADVNTADGSWSCYVYEKSEPVDAYCYVSGTLTDGRNVSGFIDTPVTLFREDIADIELSFPLCTVTGAIRMTTSEGEINPEKLRVALYDKSKIDKTGNNPIETADAASDGTYEIYTGGYEENIPVYFKVSYSPEEGVWFSSVIDNDYTLGSGGLHVDLEGHFVKASGTLNIQLNDSPVDYSKWSVVTNNWDGVHNYLTAKPDSTGNWYVYVLKPINDPEVRFSVSGYLPNEAFRSYNIVDKEITDSADIAGIDFSQKIYQKEFNGTISAGTSGITIDPNKTYISIIANKNSFSGSEKGSVRVNNDGSWSVLITYDEEEFEDPLYIHLLEIEDDLTYNYTYVYDKPYYAETDILTNLALSIDDMEKSMRVVNVTITDLADTRYFVLQAVNNTISESYGRGISYNTNSCRMHVAAAEDAYEVLIALQSLSGEVQFTKTSFLIGKEDNQELTLSMADFRTIF